MKKLLITLWLLVPVVLAAYHYGPGQAALSRDDVDGMLEVAEHYAEQEDWLKAIELYDSALGALPEKNIRESRQVRVAKARAQMFARQLPEANQALEELVREMTADVAADPNLLSDARSAVANSQYYMTWLMRLEGAAKEDWEPQIESARQNYRLLAERGQKSGDVEWVKENLENLESAIRLARLDLKELQGLPLPSQ